MNRREITSPCKGEVDREAVGRGSRFTRTVGMTKRARLLRKEPTNVENKLWRALRRDQLEGFHFRRQHPIGPYVLDFYCAEIRLGIELDGGQHGFTRQQQRDAQRTRWLAERKIEVMRFWNNDVISNFEGVLSKIVRIARERRRTLTPSPTLPLSGGGSGSPKRSVSPR